MAARLNALDQLRAEKKARRLVQLLVGLVGYGIGVALLVSSGLGATSWNVLAEGISLHTPLSFGMATNLIGLAVLVFWVPLRELPGIGTLLNIVLVGTVADLALARIPSPAGLGEQAALLAAGVLVLTFFNATYLGARFGSGPRDGLMTAGVRVTGRPVWVVRTGIEVLVLVLGVLLGGTAGIGTLLVALLMGPLVGLFLPRTTVELRVDSAADR